MLRIVHRRDASTSTSTIRTSGLPALSATQAVETKTTWFLPSCGGDESQTDSTSFAISLEVTVPMAPEGERVWRCLAVEKHSQVELRVGPWHTEPRPRERLASMPISILTLSSAGIRKKGGEATAAGSGAPEPGELWQCSWRNAGKSLPICRKRGIRDPGFEVAKYMGGFHVATEV